MSDLFTFPNPVNERAARSVAAGVVLMTVTTLALSLAASSEWLALSLVIAYGFLARVATGPTLSPLGQLATRVIAPRLGTPRPVAGPPKRFAQLLGAIMSLIVVALHFGFGYDGAAQIFLGLIVVAAVLESAFAICIGCVIFGQLMKAGLISEETCEACANVSLRHSTVARG